MPNFLHNSADPVRWWKVGRELSLCVLTAAPEGRFGRVHDAGERRAERRRGAWQAQRGAAPGARAAVGVRYETVTFEGVATARARSADGLAVEQPFERRGSQPRAATGSGRPRGSGRRSGEESPRYCALKLNGTTTSPPLSELGNFQPWTVDCTQLVRPG